MTGPSCGRSFRMWIVSTTSPRAFLCPSLMIYPREYNAVNVNGTGHADGSDARCRRAAGRVYLFRSGVRRPGEQPLQETAIPNPCSPYAVSKLASEYYVRTIGDLWSIETVSLRVLQRLRSRARPASLPSPGDPIFLTPGDPRRNAGGARGWRTQTRDYVFLDDARDRHDCGSDRAESG